MAASKIPARAACPRGRDGEVGSALVAIVIWSAISCSPAGRKGGIELDLSYELAAPVDGCVRVQAVPDVGAPREVVLSLAGRPRSGQLAVGIAPGPNWSSGLTLIGTLHGGDCATPPIDTETIGTAFGSSGVAVLMMQLLDPEVTGGGGAGGGSAGGSAGGAAGGTAGGGSAGGMAGAADAGALDAGGSDAGSVDAGAVDAGGVDAGGVDAGSGPPPYGAACSAGCDAGLTCYTNAGSAPLTGGFCSKPCMAQADCPSQLALCGTIEGFKLCVPRCNPSSGMQCRLSDGYACCSGQQVVTSAGGCGPESSNFCGN